MRFGFILRFERSTMDELVWALVSKLRCDVNVRNPKPVLTIPLGTDQDTKVSVNGSSHGSSFQPVA
jgi:hypothetical protein